MPEVRGDHFLSEIERQGFRFSHILVIPNPLDFWSLWVSPKSVGGMLDSKSRQQVLVPERQWTKRILDLVLTVGGAIICLPIFVLIALWIKWDSPGPVFSRSGASAMAAKDFRAWKFRSMISTRTVCLRSTSTRLTTAGRMGAHAQTRDDPALLAGRFLRRTSMDELPQLWNVWKGEMSLVGPRPLLTPKRRATATASVFIPR
jgi:lipopolysaccharide/colanic/teichoic acid biosynthesis glycosyltransferase